MLVALTVICLFGGIWLYVWVSDADDAMRRLGICLSELHLVCKYAEVHPYLCSGDDYVTVHDVLGDDITLFG